jgi:hypothetical protein
MRHRYDTLEDVGVQVSNQRAFMIAGLTGIVAAVLSLMIARRKECSPRREALSGLKASA